jgi:outer membrane protein
MLRLLILFVLLTPAALGQQWTLQQCIDRALQYNIQIKQSSLANDVNKLTVTQSSLNMLPNINGNASQNYYYGRSIDPYTNTYTDQQVRSNSFSLSSNLTLFEGFQLQNTLRESKLNYLASQNDLRKIQNDVSINVVNYYLQVLYNQELLTTTKDQFDASVIQRDRTKRMYEVGSLNKGAYLDMESQMATDEVRYIQAQSQLDQSLLSLTQLLELDTVKNFSVAKPEIGISVFDSTTTDIDKIYSVALTTQPDIKSSDYKVMSAEKGVAIARGAQYPRLFLTGALSTNYSTSSKDVNYTYGPPTQTFVGFTTGGDTVYSYVPNATPVFTDVPFRTQLDNNLGKSVGFTLQVPIFNGWATRTTIQKAKINLEQSRLNNDLTRKNLYKSVQQAVADVIASYRKFNASERSVAALQEAFNFNQQRLDLGLINTYDYLLAKNNLANAQATLLQAKYDCIFKVKILDFYQGKPLSF